MSIRNICSLWRLALFLLLAFLAACNGSPQPQTAQPSATFLAPPPTAGAYPQPTALPASPIIAPAYPAITPELPTAVVPATAALPQSSGAILAYLKDGDIWLLDEPGGQPYPLSVTGDIISFAWAFNGERIAAFNGKSICFIHRDGSVRTACLELGLNETQARVKRNLLLSRDQRWIVLWNPEKPQDEDTIGWMIVALDNTNIMYRITDPVEWGAALDPNNEPGGFTGEPIFLADNQLVGTLSHRNLCGEAGCHYQLFQFDLAAKTFFPYPSKPIDGFSEGARLLLSPDLRFLTNFSALKPSCEQSYSLVNIIDIQSQTNQSYQLDQETLIDLDFKPGMQQATLARQTGCNLPTQSAWAAACGLAKDQDVLPMQLWNVATDKRKDIYPGLTPRWGPDGDWIAFQSCLSPDSTGDWAPTGNATVSIYLLNPTSGELIQVSDGSAPQWRPKP